MLLYFAYIFVILGMFLFAGKGVCGSVRVCVFVG